MDWKIYINDMVYGIPGIGFIADEDPNPPRSKVFVGFNNNSPDSSFIDKMGHWYSHHRPPDHCSFSSNKHFYTFDKGGELIGEYISPWGQSKEIFLDANKALRLITAARDLAIVHQALTKPLERIIHSLEKAAKK